jgi:hypothetical protein
MDTSFIKLRTFFYKVFFIINTLSSTLHEMLYAHHTKLFAKVLELFMLTSDYCHSQDSIFGVLPSGSQILGISRVLN